MIIHQSLLRLLSSLSSSSSSSCSSLFMIHNYSKNKKITTNPTVAVDVVDASRKLFFFSSFIPFFNRTIIIDDDDDDKNNYNNNSKKPIIKTSTKYNNIINNNHFLSSSSSNVSNFESNILVASHNNVCRRRRHHQLKNNHRFFTTSTTLTTTTSTSATSLPVIQIKSLNNNDKEELFRVGKELDKAFRTNGFAYLSYCNCNCNNTENTDDDDDVIVSYELINQVLQLSRDFFNLPLEEKEVISMINENEDLEDLKQQHSQNPTFHNQEAPVRGYQKLGDNITLGNPDNHEAIDFIRDCPPPSGDSIRETNHHHPLAGINKWPKQPSEMEYILKQYISKMIQIGNYLLKSIAIANRIPYEEILPKFNDPFWIMRVIRYPPIITNATTPTTTRQESMGCGEHTDYGCFTFVLADDETIPDNCLQVYDQYSQTWIDAKIPHSNTSNNNCTTTTWIVNCGDMLSHWSCGKYQSTPHRVINPTTSSRISVPFFFEPNFHSTIVPLSKYFLVDDDDDDDSSNSSDDETTTSEVTKSESSKAIKFGDHVTHRLLSNFRYSPNIEKNSERKIS